MDWKDASIKTCSLLNPNLTLIQGQERMTDEVLTEEDVYMYCHTTRCQKCNELFGDEVFALFYMAITKGRICPACFEKFCDWQMNRFVNGI